MFFKGRVKMKKILISVLSMLMLLSVMAFSAFADDIGIVVDGKQIASDVSPQVISERTLVPVRFVAEALGATVNWVSDKKMVIINKDSTNITLFLDSLNANKNGQTLQLDVPATALNDRTLVPLRFISENLGCSVEWDGVNNAVIINSVKSGQAGGQDSTASNTSESTVTTSTDTTNTDTSGTNTTAANTGSTDIVSIDTGNTSSGSTGSGSTSSGSTGSSSTSKQLTGSYTITEKNRFAKDIQVTLDQSNGISYYNVYYKGNSFKTAPTSLGTSLTTLSQMLGNINDLTIKFFSDANGSKLKATATLSGNGSSGQLVFK